MNLIALHLNLRFLKVHFSVIIQFLVVHVTSNSKLLHKKISNVVERGNVLKIKCLDFLL